MCFASDSASVCSCPLQLFDCYITTNVETAGLILTVITVHLHVIIITLCYRCYPQTEAVKETTAGAANVPRPLAAIGSIAAGMMTQGNTSASKMSAATVTNSHR